MTHPIATERYVAFTTFRKDGSPKAVPVWIVDVGGGNVGLTTSSGTWKARRLASNPSVLLQVCDFVGRSPMAPLFTKALESPTLGVSTSESAT